MTDKLTPINTHTDGNDIKCPWCGGLLASDLWEYDHGRATDVQCGECGKWSEIEADVSVSWTACAVDQCVRCKRTYPHGRVYSEGHPGLCYSCHWNATHPRPDEFAKARGAT